MPGSVFIATPAYSGKVNAQYALALTETFHLLKTLGWEVEIKVTIAGSLLVAERNRLLEFFWQSGKDYILMVDSDLGWQPWAVVGMLESKKDFIGGVYPGRNSKVLEYLFQPKLNDDESVSFDGQLLEMECIPAGFILLSRKALGMMRDHFQDLYYTPKFSQDNKESTYCLFDTALIDGEFWGEDYVFCRRARESGLRIWVDPLIEFDHDGNKGRLITALSRKKPSEQRGGK